MLTRKWKTVVLACFCAAVIVFRVTVLLADMGQIRQKGVIRHIGVPCGRFIIGPGNGLCVDMVKGFAQYLGVDYEYVEATWETVVPYLTGQTYQLFDGQARVTGQCDIKGDIIATGLTILPWRKPLLDYSDPTFPSGIWLITRADSPLAPIVPQGSVKADIEKVKSLITGLSVLAKPGTCLDPVLYGFENCGAHWVTLDKKVYEFVPVLMNNEVQCSLGEVADAMLALEKWPGKIKIIGPVSPPLKMGCGFRKSDPQLRKAFNEYLRSLKKSGRYMEMVKNYYPGITVYFPDFFAPEQGR